MSDSGVSAAVGEFKELLDSDGGSGFSFVDLAADMAGVAFAERLLADPGSALRAQSLLGSAASEELFFPAVSGLEEGLSQARFEARYGGLADPRYERLRTDIGARLALTPLHRDGDRRPGTARLP
jgi:hypothetical protein